MTQAIDNTLIDQIVGEVLSQLRRRINGAPKQSVPSHTNNMDSPIAAIEFSDTVITEDTLKHRAKPSATICVAANAILTPSARDFIRIHHISLSRKGRGASSPLMKLGTIIAAHLPEVVQSLLVDVRKQFQSLWTVEMESGTSQVVDRVRSVICRAESRQVLMFVKSPHKVACLVNRHSNCRAAVVRCATDVRRVRSEFPANVICVDLEQPTFIGLREVLRTCGETVGQISDFEGSEN